MTFFFFFAAFFLAFFATLSFEKSYGIKISLLEVNSGKYNRAASYYRKVKYTYMSIKDKPVCGAHLFTTYWLDKWFNVKDPMQYACNLHDQGYERHIHTKGGSSESSKAIDEAFWKEMGRLIKYQKNVLIKGIMYVQRPLYYGLVRVYGYFMWSKKAGG